MGLLNQKLKRGLCLKVCSQKLLGKFECYLAEMVLAWHSPKVIQMFLLSNIMANRGYVFLNNKIRKLENHLAKNYCSDLKIVKPKLS